MNKKNVAIIIDSLGGGGAERVVLNLAKGLLEAGHYPHVFCLESRIDHVTPDGIDVTVLYPDRTLKSITRGRNAKVSASKLMGAVKGIESKSGRFNLYLSNLDPTNNVVSKCDFKNVYYVLHSAMKHELDRAKKLGPIKYWKKLKAKKVMSGKDLVAVSQGVCEEANSIAAIKPNTVTTIYNPIDSKQILKQAEEVNSLIPTEPYIVHVGRVVKAKRHDVLLKALAMVPDVKLVLLCKDIEKIRVLAEKYGVIDRVVTPGFTNNPYNWIKHAELMVLSSDYEGLSMVLLESAVCGTAMVSTDCNYGPNEILTGELKKYLSPCGDFKALAKNIELALKEKPNVNDLPILNEVTLDKAVEQYIALAD